MYGQMAMALTLVLLHGCATRLTGITQTVAIETLDKGSPVSGASCQLANDKGTWTATAPASVEIAKSTADLKIRCDMAGLQPALATVHPGANAPEVRKALDKAIDVVTESTRIALPDYPQEIKVEFGRTLEIGQRGK